MTETGKFVVFVAVVGGVMYHVLKGKPRMNPATAQTAAPTATMASATQPGAVSGAAIGAAAAAGVADALNQQSWGGDALWDPNATQLTYDQIRNAQEPGYNPETGYTDPGYYGPSADPNYYHLDPEMT